MIFSISTALLCMLYGCIEPKYQKLLIVHRLYSYAYLDNLPSSKYVFSLVGVVSSLLFRLFVRYIPKGAEIT